MSEVELREPPVGGYSVTLPSFEGPLDLLLHLCQKHELDVLEIPIGFVTEKYLEYLAVMQLINLDLASEYLVMAATLAHIKSKMLLPAPPPGQEDDATSEEEEDPREALIRRLLEYQKYKQAAADLAARGVAGRDVFLRGMPVETAADTGLPPLAQVQLFTLVEAFQTVLSKSKVKLTHDIVHERMTLTDRINELVDVLRVKRRLQFEELFTGLATRFDLVITFLALLEMTRLRMTRLFQLDPTAPIFVEFTAQVSSDDGETIAFPDPNEAPPTVAAEDAAPATTATPSRSMFDDPEPSALEIDLGGASAHDLASQPSIPSGHELASATDDVSDHDVGDAAEPLSRRGAATIPSEPLEPLSRDSISVLAVDVAIHDVAGHGLASAPDLDLEGDEETDLPRDTLAPTDDLSTVRPPDGPEDASDDATVRNEDENDPEDPS